MQIRSILGVNFSHRHADWLGLDPDALLAELLDRIGVRYFRLSVYWDEIAPAPDQLDFTPVRRWLDPLQERGARALLTVGLRAQRWPEFYPPAWLEKRDYLPKAAWVHHHPRVVAHLLLMLERLTAFLADYDAIDSWQVENEPFLPGMKRTVAWQFSPALLGREIAVVREADPRHRPIVVNHSTQNLFDRRWLHALTLGDVIAENVYTRKPNRWPFPRYFNPYSVPLLGPDLRLYSRVARGYSKPLWVTELQAEPWEQWDVKRLTAAETGSISPDRIEANLGRAVSAGAQRVYLWGAEWWRYVQERDGDRRYWDLARRLFHDDMV
jgi:hypothetical protein